jgi:hypothetical protein
MAKTIASSSKPGAWIVTPNDKGRKSIKSGKVFLNDGDEFEIELFNPLPVSVLTDIKLNGQSISKTGLVLKPGQRVYLDCFIDDKRKFIFKTYEIDGSQESIDATQNNGLLEVFFYKEDVITLDNWKSRFDTVIVERWYPVYYPSYPYHRPNIWYGTSSPVYGSCVTTNGLNNIGSLSSGTITTNTALYSSNSINSSYTNGVDLSNLNIDGSLSSNMTPINSSLETGRIEKGEKSSQKFTEVDMEFEKHYISSVIVQILPESRKPAEINEVSKSKKIMERLKSTDKVELKDILKRESQDVIELIKKLADLHSAGILTDEEFSNKKTELLSKI